MYRVPNLRALRQEIVNAETALRQNQVRDKRVDLEAISTIFDSIFQCSKIAPYDQWKVQQLIRNGEKLQSNR